MKKTTNKFYQRVLALVLALMLCVGMMPMAAFAEGENEPAPEVTQSEPAPVENDPVTPGSENPDTSQETSDPAPETPDEDEGETPDEGQEPAEGENPDEGQAPAEDVKPDEGQKPEVKPEEPIVETVPAEVQAFLDAVAAIPAITPENAAEVAEYVYGPVYEAYEALSGTEYEEREDVQTAVIAYASAVSAVDAMMGMGSDDFSEAQLPYATADGTYLKKSAFENAYNLGQSDTCYGIVNLNGEDVVDWGTPNVWPTGNWEGSVNVTGYDAWGGSGVAHIVNSNPNVATVSAKNEGGKLIITFTPGKSKGTTKVSVGVDALYPHYSLGTWNMNLNFDYTVTNNVGGSGGDEVDKPEKPTVEDVPATSQDGYVYIKCVTYPNSNPHYNSTRKHAGFMSLRNSTGGWSFGEVYANDGRFGSDISAEDYPWFCDMTLDKDWYLYRWNSNYSSREGTHYLADNDPVSMTFVSDGSEWYYFTEDVPLVVWITHKKPVEPTYTVTYTDGVDTEEVFVDQVTPNLTSGTTTPAFKAADKGTETLANGTVQPKREGYKFMGWAPAVAAKVTENVTYVATWEKLKINGIVKKLVKTSAEAEAAGLDVTGITYPDSNGKVTIPKDGSVTLLYKITVTGAAGAAYKVTDDGATYVSGDPMEGTIPSDGDAVIYVKRTFTAANIDSNGKLKNTATVKPGKGNESSTSSTESTPAEEKEDTKRTFKVIYHNESGVDWMSVEDSAKNGFLNMPEWHMDEGVTENPHEMKVSDKVPTRDGYIFKHWQWGGDAHKTFKPGDTITLTADPETLTEVAADLYAIWELVPDKPEKPTHKNVRDMIEAPVTVTCDTEDTSNSSFGYTGDKTDRVTIGEVEGNATDGYTCTVTFIAQKFCDAYNALTSVTKEHTLAENQENVVLTLTWDGTKKAWKLPVDFIAPVTIHVVCETVKDPKILVKKSHSNLHTDSETGNIIVDYTVNVTNESGFTIYGLKLTDTLTPTLTGEGADATYTFRDWKVNGGEPLAVSSGANGLFHEIGMLDRNVEFADKQTVTLTYTVEIAPNSSTEKVRLYNEANAYSWSKQYQAPARAFFMAARSLDFLYPDEPDISGSGSSSTGDSDVSGSDSSDTGEIVIPTKYNVYYDWGTLPEGVTATLPTGKTGPEGSHFTVDTNYTSETTIEVGGKTYVFSGWTVPGDIETEKAEGDYNGQYIMPDHDVEITGRWDEVVEPEQPDEYTITVKYVDDNGNTIKPSGTVTTTNGGEYDVNYLKVDIENYTYVDADKPLTGKVVEDTTITLTYSRNQYTYTLTYNANGGNGAPGQQTYSGTETSHNFTVSVTTPTRSGYRFTGWNTAANGTGTSYPANSTITATVADPTRTLYAQWSYITPGPDPDPDPTHTPTPTPTPDPTPSPEPTDEPTDIPDPTPPLTESPDITPTPSTPPVSPDPEPSEPPIEIPDDDTPLAPSPDVTPDDDLTEIDDEDVPLADVPKTGDDAKIWLTLALLSAAGLGVIGLMQRRTRKNGRDS